MENLKEQVNIEKLPQHVAIIMDGNGRWAKKRHKHRTFGHQQGVVSVRETTEAAAELGIKHLTLYAFSTENWNRPKFEIDALMHLLVKTIHKETKTLNENNIRLSAIGDLTFLPKDCYKELMKAIDSTANNTRTTLNLALSYSARWEIANAAKKIAEDAKNNQLSTNNIDSNLFQQYLTTSEVPDPDILIRTGGNLRVSNFLLWQIAYAELYFTETLWPDFRKNDFYKAVIDFQSRERRFGRTSEQLNKQEE